MKLRDLKETAKRQANNPELKKIIKRVKNVQGQLNSMLQDKTWVEEARKYADKQSKEVRKLLANDASKVREFIEKERKELEKFQKQIPSEVEKIRKYVAGQRKELEKILSRMGKTKPASKRKSTGTRKKKAASEASGA